MHKHPHHEHRQHKVERARVAHLTKGYASGGAVRHEEAEESEPTARKARKRGGMMAEGKKAKHRRDRAMRAKGGRAKHRADGGSAADPVPYDQMSKEERDRMNDATNAVGQGRAKGGRVGKGKGATHVNVIIGGQKDNAPMPVPVPAGGAPMAAPPPAMGAGLAPHPPISSPPPGAGAVPMIPRAKGGRVKDGPAYREGIRAGTAVQHSDGKGQTNTKANLNRGRPITFADGGKVESVGKGSLMQHAKEHARLKAEGKMRAAGGAVEAEGRGKMGGGPKLPGGVVAGESRIAQASRAKSRFAKPTREEDGAR